MLRSAGLTPLLAKRLAVEVGFNEPDDLRVSLRVKITSSKSVANKLRGTLNLPMWILTTLSIHWQGLDSAMISIMSDVSPVDLSKLRQLISEHQSLGSQTTSYETASQSKTTAVPVEPSSSGPNSQGIPLALSSSSQMAESAAGGELPPITLALEPPIALAPDPPITLMPSPPTASVTVLPSVKVPPTSLVSDTPIAAVRPSTEVAPEAITLIAAAHQSIGPLEPAPQGEPRPWPHHRSRSAIQTEERDAAKAVVQMLSLDAEAKEQAKSISVAGGVEEAIPQLLAALLGPQVGIHNMYFPRISRANSNLSHPPMTSGATSASGAGGGSPGRTGVEEQHPSTPFCQPGQSCLVNRFYLRCCCRPRCSAGPAPRCPCGGSGAGDQGPDEPCVEQRGPKD